MNTKLRLLPVLIIVAGLGTGTKAVGIWSELRPFVGVTGAQAKEGNAKKEAQEDAAHGEASADEHADDEAGHGEEAAAEHTEDDAKADSLVDDGPQFSRAEVEMLQNLVERRETLDLRARELDIRDNLLSAAEQRIDEKIVQLKTIEATIQDLLDLHDDQEEKKLGSLVRIYESMKPKQAARIFEQLDIDILIDVAERMNERKIAPILAQMNPEKAKTVTVEIRTRKQLPETGGG